MSKDERLAEAINKLRDNGYRITSQRRALLKLIIENEYSSCKEIYYAAKKVDEKVGIATVYRTVQMLESIHLMKKEIVVQI
ncbi:MAG: Fur family transcriptional regulator [Suipraeoptans sp.]